MRSRMLASPDTPRSIKRMSLASSLVTKKFISCAAASGSAEVVAIEISIDGFRYWPGFPSFWFGTIVMLSSSVTSFWLATSWFEWMNWNSACPVTSIDSSIFPALAAACMSAGGVNPSSCIWNQKAK